LKHLSVQNTSTSDILGITGTSPDPAQAVNLANAVAKAYLENRRLYAVGTLQRTVDDLTVRLSSLQHQIASYDAKIGTRESNPAPQQLLRPLRSLNRFRHLRQMTGATRGSFDG